MMHLRLVLATFLLLCGFLSLSTGEDPKTNPTPIRPGMKASEVRGLWGKPTHVSKQILFRRHLEQWQYDDHEDVIVEFDCYPGREPVVTAVFPRPKKKKP